MKILGSDFDGTLSHGGIGEEKLSAIKAWRKAGNKFGIVSGRGVTFCQDLRKKYPELEMDFFAACNGAYIVDENGTAIYESHCNAVSMLEFATDLLYWGCSAVRIIKGKQELCVIKAQADKPAWALEENVRLLADFDDIDWFSQISVYFSTVEEATKMTEKIQQKYQDCLNPLQNGRCIDIVATDVNKAQGLYRVMEFFGGSYDDVIAVGDNLNDVDMLREFHSYAMANGVEAIRPLADGIVSDVVELLQIENTEKRS